MSWRRKLRRNSDTLEREGFVWFRAGLSEAELEDLESELEFGERPGYRPHASRPLLSKLAPPSPLGRLASRVLPNARPVRIVAFNKSPEANWAVPWHQDRVLAVRNREEVEGYSGWTRRDATWHVQPPLPILQNMVFARVHFDRNDQQNGAMELASGSHRHGYVSQTDAGEIARKHPSAVCEAERGDVVFIKALTLHRSLSSTSDAPRRALRIDYSNQDLPAPLEWAF